MTAPGAAAPPCAKLRTKGMYLPENPRADRHQEGGSPTAGYWCAATLKPVGPDGSHVGPHACRAPRSCFEPHTKPTR